MEYRLERKSDFDRLEEFVKHASHQLEWDRSIFVAYMEGTNDKKGSR